MTTSICRCVLTGFLSLAAMFAGSAQSAQAQTPPPNSPYVKVHQGRFYVNGQPFTFGGTNAYYLYQYENFNPAGVGPVMDTFMANNIAVARTWACYDGADESNVLPLQPSAGVYDETAWRKFDSVIKKARDRNLRLIVSLVNYWHEFGGVAQYCQWSGYTGAVGSSPNREEMLHFCTSESARTLYKNYISMVLNRVNTLTGTAYKNETAIFAWELMNEARLPSTSETTTLRNWYQEMARHIKGIDPNHLVTTGEEGFEEGMDYAGSPYRRTLSNTYVLRAGAGTSFSRNTQIPEIDFAQIHIYPDAFGFSSANNCAAWAPDSVTYIEDHARIAASYGKPLFVGEYGSGWKDGFTADSAFKQSFYSALWAACEREPNVAGTAIWQLINGSVWPSKTSESGGNISTTRDPILVTLIQQHHTRMRSKNGILPPPPTDITPPSIALTSPTTAPNFTAGVTPLTLGGVASDNVGVTSVTYSNAANGASGTASGTTSFSASVALASGSNLITVTARDAAGNTATDSITVTYAAPDSQLPGIAIAIPTTSTTFSTTSTPITLGGSASDNVSVSSVSFLNAANGMSGMAGGTTSWSASVALASGSNLITLTAFDAAGNSSSDSITVTYSPPPPPPSSDKLVIYGDSLATGWSDWSWSSTRNFAGTSPVNSGTRSIAVTTTIAWGALSVHSNAKIAAATYSAVEFYAHGGSVSEGLYVALGDGTFPNLNQGSTLANGWKKFSIPLSTLNPNNLAYDRISIQSTKKDSFTIDDLALVGAPTVSDSSIPMVSITTPTSASTYSTSANSVTLGGTAFDNVGVTSVTFRNGANSATGNATGTESWSATIALVSGSNAITVTARDAAGNSGTDLITVTVTPVGDTTPPSQVTGLTVGGATVSSLALSWSTATDNVGVTGYNVHRSITNGFTPSASTLLTTISGTSHVDSVLTASTTYYYRIIARDAAGNAGTASAQAGGTTSAPTPIVGVPPGPRIPVDGGKYFLLGANYGWRSYGRDIGTGPWGHVGVSSANYNAAYASDFAGMQSRGVHALRWWIFSDGRAGLLFDASGTPTGLSPKVFEDFDAALALARARNVRLIPTFLDFMFLNWPTTSGGAQMGGRANVLRDPAKTTALLNNCLIPILQRYGQDPYILAWEPMNEPEWIISDLPSPSVTYSAVDPITMAQFWNFASKLGTAIHQNTRHYYTSGSACLKWNKVWTNAFADKKGLPRPNFDFYQCHYYSWMNGLSVTNDPDLGTVQFNPLVQRYADLNLDHPMVVGECPLPAGSAQTILNTYYNNGYAGVWPWVYTGGSIDWTTFTSWGNAHAAEVNIPPAP